jgi:hypothetical protein
MGGSAATVHAKGLPEKNIDLPYNLVYAENFMRKSRPL